jgi:hypothetical protein
VAYVCPTLACLERGAQEFMSDGVERWTELFEEQYSEGSRAGAVDPNLVGWNSSYTGEAVDQD